MSETENHPRVLWPAFPAALVAAMGASLVVFLICTYGFDMTMALVDPATGEREVMGIKAIVGSNAVSTLGATLLFALLVRYTRRPLRIFHIVAGAVLLLSMIPVVFAPVNTGATRIVMAILHVVAALAIVVILGRMSQRTRDKAIGSPQLVR
jgi:glucan phosphoethanolaminetransferase (alkaline phosphatase superfamily)